jgi:GH24 family phage-related lysozyme (muramidase)
MLVFVKLYQREFDANIDVRFNAGFGSTDFTGGFKNTAPHTRLSSSSITNFLNRGRYTQAGNRILTIANSAVGAWHKGVQNRRNDQKNVFFGPQP